MHAEQVCHKIMTNALDWMHTLRREALNSCILAATDGRQLSVTGLGRAIRSTAKEKHCIKRADRLLSNPHLYREHRDIYHVENGVREQLFLILEEIPLCPKLYSLLDDFLLIKQKKE